MLIIQPYELNILQEGNETIVSYSQLESITEINYGKHFKIMFYNNLDFNNKDKDHIMQWNSEY